MASGIRKITDLLNGSAGLRIKPGWTYVIFFDPRATDRRNFEDIKLPIRGVDIVLVPLIPEPGMTVAESVAAQAAAM